MIFFRSRELLHENLPFTGERRSIVFTMDHNAFLSPGQRVARQYYSKSHLNIMKDEDDSYEEIEFADKSDDDSANEDYNGKPIWRVKKRRKIEETKTDGSEDEESEWTDNGDDNDYSED